LTPEEEEIAFWDFRESIPGDPETDYPILDRIPKTSFDCVGKLPGIFLKFFIKKLLKHFFYLLRFLGYYADVETRCQVFHICIALPRGEVTKNSFLCPNGTIFGQKQFSCQWYCSYITVPIKS